VAFRTPSAFFTSIAFIGSTIRYTWDAFYHYLQAPPKATRAYPPFNKGREDKTFSYEVDDQPREEGEDYHPRHI
jgi:hypothetical protein